MLSTLRAIVRNGKIELLEPTPLLDGSHLLVTILEEPDESFWTRASSATLTVIWDHREDDVYAELLTI